MVCCSQPQLRRNITVHYHLHAVVLHFNMILPTKTQQVKCVRELNRKGVPPSRYEGGRERNGKRCEGTAAKGRRGVEEEDNGREAGDLTHLVKVKKEKKGVRGGSTSEVKPLTLS